MFQYKIIYSYFSLTYFFVHGRRRYIEILMNSWQVFKASLVYIYTLIHTEREKGINIQKNIGDFLLVIKTNHE